LPARKALRVPLSDLVFLPPALIVDIVTVEMTAETLRWVEQPLI